MDKVKEKVLEELKAARHPIKAVFLRELVSERSGEEGSLAHTEWPFKREIIRSLREDGHPIIGTMDGYKLARTREEVDAYVANMVKRAEAILRRAIKTREAFEKARKAKR